MTKKSILAVPLALTATFALAQSADIDVNGDGMYSFPEVQAAMPEMTDDTFVLLDLSGDGLLDADEIAAGAEAGLLPPMEG